MNFSKFEEKANDFLQNSGILNITEEEKNLNLFTVIVNSVHKNKSLMFRAYNINIAFEVYAETLDELFDKAYRVLKSYVPKATRERNKEVESSNSTEQGE